MAKKKSQNKKHRFKHTEPSGAIQTSQGTVASASGEAKPAQLRPAPAAAVPSRDFGYVARDLRRIAVFATALIALEVALWYAFNNTGLGATVYSLFKV